MLNTNYNLNAVNPSDQIQVSQQEIDAPENAKKVLEAMSVIGTALGIAKMVPGHEQYLDDNKLNIAISINNLPSQAYEITEGVKELSSDKQKTPSEIVKTSAKIASAALKIFASSATLIKPLLPTPLADTATKAAHYAMSIVNIIDYGVQANNLYEKLLTNNENSQ
jgi:hypothetical protein